jgi:uncharacterized membrane protein/mono/diheme cytochrome c family protein
VIWAVRIAGIVRGLQQRTRRIPIAWVGAIIASVVVVFLPPRFFFLDGRSHSDWLQFLGRFHPLVVHLPIGLILLLPLLELAGARRPALREAAGLVLQSALVTCVASIFFGFLLAYGSGEMGATVTRHMRGGIVLALELLLCNAVRVSWVAGRQPRFYPTLLAGTLLTLAWTAHHGGSLTHGSDYLTRYMPAPIKRVLAPSAVAANPGSFFARHIYPVLDTKCVACHGTNKEQGGLRLDSYESLMAGGKDGVVIAPRNPDGSVLLHKVTLPPSDPHFMPAEGRTPLTPDEIAKIHAWVLAGASAEAVSVPGVFVAEDREALQPVDDYSALMTDIRQMQQLQGAKLVAVSANPSDGLILRTVDVAASFDDAQLARFERFAPFIVEAELGRTAVTDASLETLSQFKHLRALHLEGTAVSGRTLGKLSSLSQLTYLNLSGTKVTSEAVATLKNISKLRHLYLFDTPAELASPTAENSIRSAQ